MSNLEIMKNKRSESPRKSSARRCALSLLAVLLLPLSSLHAEAPPLSAAVALRAEIDEQHSGVDWVETGTLTNWMSNSKNRQVVLLDVREQDEYSISHLQGARRVAPEARDMAALNLPRDATIIVYCSVGYRSAALAQRLEAAGHQQVFNLLGGIFQWANEGRPVYSGSRRVNLVHPYDHEWGEMLNERYRSALE